jgi:hypothetical protein
MKHSALLSFLILGTLTAPTLAYAANAAPAAAQSERSRERAERRVYDREHKDYHVWDDAEDRLYHTWLETKHFVNREFSKLNRTEQRDYWRWRHDHHD